MNQEIIARQKRAMAEKGLDGLISISPENVAYTTGIVVPSQSLMRWRHAISVLTSDGRLAMVVIDMEESTVRAHGGVAGLKVYREFAEDPMNKLCEVLTDLRLGRSKQRTAPVAPFLAGQYPKTALCQPRGGFQIRLDIARKLRVRKGQTSWE